MTAPLTILDRMTALLNELSDACDEAEYDAFADSHLEEALANAYVAIKRVAEREPETRAEREADYRFEVGAVK